MQIAAMVHGDGRENVGQRSVCRALVDKLQVKRDATISRAGDIDLRAGLIEEHGVNVPVSWIHDNVSLVARLNPGDRCGDLGNLRESDATIGGFHDHNAGGTGEDHAAELFVRQIKSGITVGGNPLTVIRRDVGRKRIDDPRAAAVEGAGLRGGTQPEGIHVDISGSAYGQVFVTAPEAGAGGCASGSKDLSAIRLAEIGEGLTGVIGFPDVHSPGDSLYRGNVQVAERIVGDTRFNVLIENDGGTGIHGIIGPGEFEGSAKSHLARLIARFAVGDCRVHSDLCGS